MATKQLAVIVIHGMGSQEPGYADGLIAELRALIGHTHNDSDIAWKQVYWADITERRQLAYLREARRQNELDQNKLRRFVVGALGDASAYQRVYPAPTQPVYEKVREIGTYYRIHERVAAVIRDIYANDLDSKPVPLVVLAHSLGGHIFSNYYWDVQRPTQSPLLVPMVRGQVSPFERLDWLAGIVTFGCNIPLFTFSLDKVTPIRFPSSRLKKELKEKARWLNFFDPDDVLGYPLRPLSQDYAKVVTQDIEIDVGNPLIGWTPVSHTQYWTDNDFTRQVADYLRAFLE